LGATGTTKCEDNLETDIVLLCTTPLTNTYTKTHAQRHIHVHIHTDRDIQAKKQTFKRTGSERERRESRERNIAEGERARESKSEESSTSKYAGLRKLNGDDIWFHEDHLTVNKQFSKAIQIFGRDRAVQRSSK